MCWGLMVWLQLRAKAVNSPRCKWYGRRHQRPHAETQLCPVRGWQLQWVRGAESWITHKQLKSLSCGELTVQRKLWWRIPRPWSLKCPITIQLGNDWSFGCPVIMSHLDDREASWWSQQMPFTQTQTHIPTFTDKHRHRHRDTHIKTCTETSTHRCRIYTQQRHTD